MAPSVDPETSSGLLRLLAGSPGDDVWRTFVVRYSPLIEASCRAARLQPADVDEVRSRVLIRLVEALSGFRYDPARSFRGYIRTVVLNAVRGYWRERARPGACGSGDPAVAERLDEVPVPESLAGLADSLDEDATRRLRLIAAAIERVRTRVGEDVWRAYWGTSIDGRKATEVARELGKSVGAVYMAKCRVAKLLRAAGQFTAD